MQTLRNIYVPHPFPYQGSKRGIAKHILPCFPNDVCRLIEPFCGTGAVSIAAAAHGLVQRFMLNDLNEPLMALWGEILERPARLADEYENLWNEQLPDSKGHFSRVRDKFNATHLPHHLLYLLARIVKGSVRYNADGSFNQSADNRRLGMRPGTMRENIFGVSSLLAGKTIISAMDFREVVKKAERKDLIYMDPPYQGTSSMRDCRYCRGLAYDDFVGVLSEMNQRRLSYIVSYDGATGTKIHGKRLPRSLSLRHLHIHAGRSSQATLLGGRDETIESLFPVVKTPSYPCGQIEPGNVAGRPRRNNRVVVFVPGPDQETGAIRTQGRSAERQETTATRFCMSKRPYPRKQKG